MLYRYKYIGGLMENINIFPKKLQFAVYGQFVLVNFMDIDVFNEAI